MKKIINCPAKLNLTLEIIKKMKSGFHELRTIMVKLPNLKDKLEIEIFPEKKGIEIICDNLEIPTDSKNICHKAIKKFFKKAKKEVGVKVKIKKQIPVGAGLGGGSSDAAEVFKVLNQYFRNRFSIKELIKMAAEIGKDIPFFFSEKNGSLIGGTGEKILEEFDFKKGYFLIINPRIKIPTPEAYKNLSNNLWFMENGNRIDLSRNFLENLKNNFEKYFYNDFEVFVEKKYAIIKELKQSLLTFGADGVLMSGSGSTVFGWFKDEKKFLKAKKILKEKYNNFLVIRG